MFDLNRLFDVTFWLDLQPASLSFRTVLLLASFFACFILIKFLAKAIYLNYRKELVSPEKKFLAKIESFLLTMGFSGLTWTFFAYEALPILSARLWVFVWVISGVLWLYFIARYALVEMPPQIANMKLQEQKRKYLPKKK